MSAEQLTATQPLDPSSASSKANHAANHVGWTLSACKCPGPKVRRASAVPRPQQPQPCTDIEVGQQQCNKCVHRQEFRCGRQNITPHPQHMHIHSHTGSDMAKARTACCSHTKQCASTRIQSKTSTTQLQRPEHTHTNAHARSITTSAGSAP